MRIEYWRSNGGICGRVQCLHVSGLWFRLRSVCWTKRVGSLSMLLTRPDMTRRHTIAISPHVDFPGMSLSLEVQISDDGMETSKSCRSCVDSIFSQFTGSRSGPTCTPRRPPRWALGSSLCTRFPWIRESQKSGES